MQVPSCAIEISCGQKLYIRFVASLDIHVLLSYVAHSITSYRSTFKFPIRIESQWQNARTRSGSEEISISPLLKSGLGEIVSGNGVSNTSTRFAHRHIRLPS